MKFKKKIIKHQCDEQNNFFSTFCGVVIKRIRKEIGMTGADLAKRLNISQQQMSRYERGINKFSVDTLFNVSIILNIPLEKLIKYALTEMEKSNSDDVIMLRKLITASETVYFF